MHARFLVIALILATLFQATAWSYASNLGDSVGDAVTPTCAGHAVEAHHDCPDCCPHGATSSCALQCSLALSLGLPMTPPTARRTELPGAFVSDPGVQAFAEYDPPHPLRPPIR